MKKLLTLLLALAMVLSLAACGGGDKPAENTGDSAPAGDNQDAASGDAAGDAEPDYASMTIDELKPLIQTVTDGTLTVATSPDFAPYEFYAIDDAGKPAPTPVLCWAPIWRASTSPWRTILPNSWA